MALTTNYSWDKPTVAGDSGTWGTKLNTAWDAADASLKGVENRAKNRRQDLGATGGAVALDAGAYEYYTISPNATTTFSFTNVPTGGFATAMTIRIINSVARTITWPASVKWPGGAIPAVGGAGTHLVILVTDDNGITWRGNALLAFA